MALGHIVCARKTQLLNMKLIIVFCSILTFFCAIFFYRNHSHEQIHEKLVMRDLAFEGVSIGVVVNQLREEGLFPVDAREFLTRYRSAFTIKWQPSTNSNGELLLGMGQKQYWSIRRRDGLIQRIGTMTPAEDRFLPLLNHFDLSRPFSESNTCPDLEFASKIRTTSDELWNLWRRVYENSKDYSPR